MWRKDADAEERDRERERIRNRMRKEDDAAGVAAASARYSFYSVPLLGTHFTRCTSTNVRILTQKALVGSRMR